MEAPSYPRFIYTGQSSQSSSGRPSAARIVYRLLEIVQPTSVVDVGCGVGVFLAAFSERGIEDVRGIDLPGIDMHLLRIPADKFVPWDLSKPYDADRQFDVVMSLETAEHLPASSAETFVQTLTGLGPIVVFSAAVPKQGGYRHLNEQWQDYWAQKFKARGYLPVDSLRNSLWNDPDVSPFYRQNIVMYVSKQILEDDARLRSAYQKTNLDSLSRIHPLIYIGKADPKHVTLRFLLEALLRMPVVLAMAICRRLGRLLRALPRRDV